MNLQNQFLEQAEIEKPAESFRPSKASARLFEIILNVCFVALFFGLPLFFTGFTWQGINFEKEIYFYFWILVALIAWVSRGVITGEMQIRRTPLDIPIGIFWVVYLLATIFSVDKWHSFWGFFGDPSRGLMSVTALIVAFYLISSNFTKARFAWMMGSLIVSGFLVSVWTFLGFRAIQFLPASIMQMAPLSLMGSVSALGIFFSVMMPLLITTVFQVNSSEKVSALAKKLVAGGILINILLNLLLLLAMYFYVPWEGLMIGVGVLLIFMLSQIVRAKEQWTWLPMSVFVIILVFLFVGKTAVNGSQGKNRLVARDLPIEVSPVQKLSWEVAKQSFKNNLLIGSGPATYGYAFSKYRPESFNNEVLYKYRFYQGSGVFWEIISTAGIAGLLSMTLLILTFLSVVFYLLSRDKEKNKLYSLGLASAVLILVVDAARWRLDGSMLILGVLIGTLALSMLLKESESEHAALTLSLKASPKYALTLAFVFMVVSAGVVFLFVFIGKVFVADVYAGMAARNKEITEESTIEKLSRASALYPYEGRYFTLAGQTYMILTNNEYLKSKDEAKPELLVRYINAAIATSTQGVSLMKSDVLAQEVLAQNSENGVLYSGAFLDATKKAYERALELEPNNPDYFVKLGQVEFNRIPSGKTVDEKKQYANAAIDWFNKSIEKKKNFADGYYNLALAQEALGQIDEAIGNMNMARQYNPQSASYLFKLGNLYQEKGDETSLGTAETIYKNLLKVNDKDINVHFRLGLVYEKMKKKTETLAEYNAVLSMLDEKQADLGVQIKKMIENVKAGIENNAQTLGVAEPKKAPETPNAIPDASNTNPVAPDPNTNTNN